MIMKEQEGKERNEIQTEKLLQNRSEMKVAN